MKVVAQIKEEGSRTPLDFDGKAVLDAVSGGDKIKVAADPEYAEVLETMKRKLRGYLNDLPGGFADLKPSR